MERFFRCRPRPATPANGRPRARRRDEAGAHAVVAAGHMAYMLGNACSPAPQAPRRPQAPPTIHHGPTPPRRRFSDRELRSPPPKPAVPARDNTSPPRRGPTFVKDHRATKASPCRAHVLARMPASFTGSTQTGATSAIRVVGQKGFGVAAGSQVRAPTTSSGQLLGRGGWRREVIQTGVPNRANPPRC